MYRCIKTHTVPKGRIIYDNFVKLNEVKTGKVITKSEGTYTCIKDCYYENSIDEIIEPNSNNKYFSFSKNEFTEAKNYFTLIGQITKMTPERNGCIYTNGFIKRGNVDIGVQAYIEVFKIDNNNKKTIYLSSPSSYEVKTRLGSAYIGKNLSEYIFIYRKEDMGISSTYVKGLQNVLKSNPLGDAKLYLGVKVL